MFYLCKQLATRCRDDTQLITGSALEIHRQLLQGVFKLLATATVILSADKTLPPKSSKPKNTHKRG